METLKEKEKQLVRNDNNDDTYVIKNHFLNEDVKIAVLEFEEYLKLDGTITNCYEHQRNLFKKYKEIFGEGWENE